MDNPWIHCISELLGWLLHWMADDPWITMDNPWIHCISELLGWLLHWMADDPWIIHGYIVFLSYCVRGRVLSLATLPSLDYSCIVVVHSDGTCYLQPSIDSPRLA